MDGNWDCVELDSMLCRLLDAHLDRRVRTLDDYWYAARARRSQLWQIVLSPRGLRGGYIAPR